MNERIREMLIKARDNTTEGKYNPPTHIWAEEFARLIIYDFMDEITNDDELGPARIDTLNRLAKKWDIGNLRV